MNESIFLSFFPAENYDRYVKLRVILIFLLFLLNFKIKLISPRIAVLHFCQQSKIVA